MVSEGQRRIFAFLNLSLLFSSFGEIGMILGRSDFASHRPYAKNQLNQREGDSFPRKFQVLLVETALGLGPSSSPFHVLAVLCAKTFTKVGKRRGVGELCL